MPSHHPPTFVEAREPQREPGALANTPSVGAISGLGAGGGAGMLAAYDGEAGFTVGLVAGAGALLAGGFTLFFGSAPHAMTIGPDDAFGPVTVTPSGNNLLIAWTAAHLLVGQRYTIAFMWSARV